MPYGIVYHAFCTETGKGYVGQTTASLNKRIKDHHNPRSCCVALKAAIEKYGRSAFVWTILFVADSKADLDAAEAYWIAFLQTRGPGGYNLRGGGSFGRHSAETKAKMSASRTGKRLSDAHRASIVIARQGRIVTAEARRRMSEAHLGQIPWNKGLSGSQVAWNKGLKRT